MKKKYFKEIRQIFKHFGKSPYILHLKRRRSNLYVLGV